MSRTFYQDELGGKKQAINSKQKGSMNERRAAKLLSAWTGQDFNRTPASGGLRWLDASRIAGDVVAPSGFDFPFCVEVKAYKSVEFKARLRKDSIVTQTFWPQCVTDAQRVNKLPLLMVRCNGMDKDAFIVFLHWYCKEAICGIRIINMCAGQACDGSIIYGYDSRHLFQLNYTEFVKQLNTAKQSTNDESE